MKISNEFFIENIKTAQMLSEADAIADETTIVYAVAIDDRLITVAHGDRDKAIDMCFTILKDIFDRDPSEFMSVMMQFIEHFLRSHNSEKVEGDLS